MNLPPAIRRMPSPILTVLKCFARQAAIRRLAAVRWQAAFSLVAGLWLITVPAARGQETQQFPVNEDNGSLVEVEHVFSAVPPGGYTAVRVTVTNKGQQELSLTVSSSSTVSGVGNQHTLTGGSVTISAPPESSLSRELIVPLMTDFSNGMGYHNSVLELGIGVAGRSYEASFRSGHLQKMPFGAISQSLAGKSAATLNEAARNKISPKSTGYGGTSDNLFLASFVPAHLPAEWRGYFGLDLLALNADEWNTLLPGVRTAIRQWIVFGGRLELYHSGPLPEAILQELKVEPERNGQRGLGSGRVRVFPWDGKELDGDALSRFEAGDPAEGGGGVRHLAAAVSLRAGTVPVPGAGIGEALGIRSFAAWQVGVILVIFGLLVGPVNLFYLAGPGRRHRLFFTTPLIALGASVVLVVVIFLQDGAGGAGQRAALIELRPDENNAYVRQYQISRTGVLFGGGFVMEEPAVVTPLVLGDSRWTRLKPAGTREAEGQRFALPEPQAYAGDWFQSRSEQAQLIETIRPGRGRLELKPGSGDPVVVSSLTAGVERLVYQDPAGQWWSSTAPLSTGATASLQKAEEAECQNWLAAQLASFPASDRRRILTQAHAGRCYALSRDPAAGLVGSLKSIRWENDLAFLHGRLAPAP